MNDKLTDHEDWRDGINAFRLKILETLVELNEEIEVIKKQLKEKTP